MMRLLVGVLMTTVSLGACGGPRRDGGHLVLGLGMSRAEVRAASRDLGSEFDRVRVDWREKRFQTVGGRADRVMVQDLALGKGFEIGESIVTLSFRDDRLCGMNLLPVTRVEPPQEDRRCLLNGPELAKLLHSASFRLKDGRSYDEEVQARLRHWQELRAEPPEFRRESFNLSFERSDGRVLLELYPVWRDGKPCVTEIWVETCGRMSEWR